MEMTLTATYKIMSENTGKEVPTQGRDNNPAHKEFFNSLISDLKLKKKNIDIDAY